MSGRDTGPRRSAFEQLGDAIARVGAGAGGGLAAVTGEAGIGKTTLLDELTASAPGPLAVVRTSGERGDLTHPFGRLLAALGGARRAGALPDDLGDRLDHVAALVTGERHDALRASPLQLVPDERLRIVDGLIGLLSSWADRAPLLVVLDDAHWADDASLAVLRRVAATAERQPLLTIVSARPHPSSDALDDVMAAAATSVGVVELGPLTDDETDALLEQLTGAPPGPSLRAASHAAGGNPFLVGEVVDLLREAGRLRNADGRTEVTGPVAPAAAAAIPRRARDAVVARMARVGEEERHVLQVAAVLGSPFQLEELAAALDRSPASLLRPLDAAVRAGLVADDGPALRFRHDLVCDALRDELGDARRRALHLHVGRSLSAHGAAPARAAEHFLRGAMPGDTEAAEILAAAAATMAQQAPITAADLYERALELVPMTYGGREALIADLVDASFWGGRVDRAVELATETLAQPIDPALRRRLHETMARCLGMLGRPAEAIDHANAMIEDGAPAAWPIALTSILRVFAMDLDGALTDAQRALDELEHGEDDPWAETLALSVLGFVHNIRGYHVRGVRYGERAVAAADRSQHREAHRMVPLVFLALSLEAACRDDEALVVLRRGEQLSEELGTTWAAPFFHYGRALHHWGGAEWDDLLAECEAGLRYARTHDINLAAGFACAVSAAAHLFQRRPDQAAALLDEGDRLLMRGGIQYGADWLAWVRALHIEASGDVDGARDLLHAAWELASGLHVGAALSLFGPDLVRLALVTGQDELARNVLVELERTDSGDERFTVDHFARRWRGALDADVTMIEDVRELHRRQRRPLELVHDDEAELVTALRAGRHTEARTLLDRVVAGADALSAPGVGDRAVRAASLLGLVPDGRRRVTRAATGWDALTTTEREVARLVADGQPNAHVATALGISRRTVESHLYRAFAKLGVRNRTELALAVVAQSRA